jgi:hypothetical protein
MEAAGRRRLILPNRASPARSLTRFRGCYKIFWVLGTGYWVLGTGYWVLGTGCAIRLCRIAVEFACNPTGLHCANSTIGRFWPPPAGPLSGRAGLRAGLLGTFNWFIGRNITVLYHGGPNLSRGFPGKSAKILKKTGEFPPHGTIGSFGGGPGKGYAFASEFCSAKLPSTSAGVVPGRYFATQQAFPGRRWVTTGTKLAAAAKPVKQGQGVFPLVCPLGFRVSWTCRIDSDRLLSS